VLEQDQELVFSISMHSHPKSYTDAFANIYIFFHKVKFVAPCIWRTIVIRANAYWNSTHCILFI